VTVVGVRSDGRSLNDPYPLAADGTTGTTLITYVATDASGNMASATQTVRVQDHEPPTITAPANITKSTDPAQCAAVVNYPAFGATDNSGFVSVTSSPPSGSAFPRGVTTVTGTAIDPSGNTSSASFTLTVNDTEPPKITAPANITVLAAGASGTVISALGTPTFSDNCPGATAAVGGLPAGNLFPIGITTLTWTATDASGNTATATQTVTVRYNVCLLYDPAKAAQLGSTIPIKLQLCTASGANLSSGSIVPHAATLVLAGSAGSPVPNDSGNANPGGDFRFDPTLGGTGGYIYDLSTKGLSSGSWKMLFTVNGQTYEGPFQIK